MHKSKPFNILIKATERHKYTLSLGVSAHSPKCKSTPSLKSKGTHLIKMLLLSSVYKHICVAELLLRMNVQMCVGWQANLVNK